MTTYSVIWDLPDVEADSPRKAAEYARRAQLNLADRTTVFDVYDADGLLVETVDLGVGDDSDDQATSLYDQILAVIVERFHKPPWRGHGMLTSECEACHAAADALLDIADAYERGSYERGVAVGRDIGIREGLDKARDAIAEVTP